MDETGRATRDRAQLGYSLEVYGGMQTVSQPYVVAVLADLHGDADAWEQRPPLADRKLLAIDLDNRDGRIRSMRPVVTLCGPGDARIQLAFESLDDFGPLAIARRHPATQALLARRTALAELQGRLIAHRDLVAPWQALLASPPAPDDGLPPWLATDDDDPERAAARLVALLDEVRHGGLHADADPVGALRNRIQALDDAIGQHVTAALADPAFRRLEAAWRGVDHLLQQLGPDTLSRVRLFSLRRDELDRALAEVGGALDRLLIDSEFGQYGGEPVGVCVLGDSFSQIPQDVQTLRAAAGLACRAHALVVAAASPVLLDSDAHATVATARGARLQRLPEYAAWRALRADPAARHLALVLPQVVSRGRHALAGLGDGEFRYAEPPASAAGAPWMSGAFALAAAVLQAQVRDGWPAALDVASAPLTLPPTAVWTGVDAAGTLRAGAALDAAFTAAEAADLAAFGLVVLGQADGSTATHLLAAPTLAAAASPATGTPAPVDLAVGLALDQIARWLRCWARDHGETWPDLDRLGGHLQALLARLTASDTRVDTRADDDAATGTALLQDAEVLDLQAMPAPDTWETGVVFVTVRCRLWLASGFGPALQALPLVVTLPAKVHPLGQ